MTPGGGPSWRSTPGTYNLEPELSSKYVTADSVEVVAKGNDGRPADSDVMDVVVSTEYTQDIREAALAAIKEKTHACVTPAGILIVAVRFHCRAAIWRS